MNTPAQEIKGVCYDTGVNYEPSKLSREFWHAEAVKHDMGVITRDLHCNAVAIFGSDHERLRDAAKMALEQKLDVWLQPRLIEGTQAESLAHLKQAAILAEELRQTYGDHITLNLGCELSIFMKGILPGNHFMRRMSGLMIFWMIMPIFNKKLNRYLKEASQAVRAHFKGPITYSAGEWEGVDWEPFDIVGVDYYRESLNASTYTAGLRQYASHGKPLAITEFGSCTFVGADKKGGGAFMIVDWRKEPPMVKPGHTRDEQVQVTYIEELVQLYRQEQVKAMFVYAFSEPQNLHTQDQRTDLDMASYGLVKITKLATQSEPEQWEPKAAFGRLAKLYDK